MKSLKLDTTNELCSIYLFRNVSNSSEIKSKVINGEIKAAVLNAALIPDILQIFVAANKASLSNYTNEKVTKTIYTEVLFNLSPTKKGMYVLIVLILLLFKNHLNNMIIRQLLRFFDSFDHGNPSNGSLNFGTLETQSLQFYFPEKQEPLNP